MTDEEISRIVAPRPPPTSVPPGGVRRYSDDDAWSFTRMLFTLLAVMFGGPPVLLLWFRYMELLARLAGLTP